MFKFRPFITYDPNEAAGGAAPPAAETQQPGAATDSRVNPGPWSSDLEQRFTDPGVRSQVDAYLRESWQPRMTQLEQQLAGRPDVPREAAELFTDLLANPDETLATVVRELYGDERGEAFKTWLTPAQQNAAETAEAQIAAGKQPSKLTLDQLPDEVREFYEEHIATKQRGEYETAVRGALEQYDGVSADDYDYVHPFIQNAGGKLDQALAAYVAYRDALRGGASTGQAVEAANEAAGETKQPPATLGSAGGSPTGTPPVEKKYGWNQLEEAARDWLSDERKGAPPVVGSV